MNSLKSNLKPYLPNSLLTAYQRLRIFSNNLLDLQYWDREKRRLPGLGWYLHPQAAASRSSMQKYKDRHKGQRCFIIGNGPSLRQMDLGPLNNEFTFGLNRIYLIFPKHGFSTTYFVSVNRLVIEQCSQEILALTMPRFISWYARDYLGFAPNLFYVRDPNDGTLGFSTDPGKRIWEGATVTYVAMQLAFYMGFQQVILIGVDHSFATTGVPHKVVTSTGNDPDHFDPGYFGKNFRWQLPDLEASELFYRQAKQYFEDVGREIVDATVGGKLNVFRKVEFNTLY